MDNQESRARSSIFPRIRNNVRTSGQEMLNHFEYSARVSTGFVIPRIRSLVRRGGGSIDKLSLLFTPSDRSSPDFSFGRANARVTDRHRIEFRAARGNFCSLVAGSFAGGGNPRGICLLQLDGSREQTFKRVRNKGWGRDERLFTSPEHVG